MIRRPKVDPPADCPSWFKSLFDLSPDPMCLAAVDGYFKWVNPAFERTLGYTVEEAVPTDDRLRPPGMESTLVAMEALASGEELRQFENRCICRDGSVRWLQWNCRPEPRRNGLSPRRARITDSVRRVEQAALRQVATVVAQGAAPADGVHHRGRRDSRPVGGRPDPDRPLRAGLDVQLPRCGRAHHEFVGGRSAEAGWENLASRILSNGRHESMN